MPSSGGEVLEISTSGFGGRPGRSAASGMPAGLRARCAERARARAARTIVCVVSPRVAVAPSLVAAALHRAARHVSQARLQYANASPRRGQRRRLETSDGPIRVRAVLRSPSGARGKRGAEVSRRAAARPFSLARRLAAGRRTPSAGLGTRDLWRQARERVRSMARELRIELED